MKRLFSLCLTLLLATLLLTPLFEGSAQTVKIKRQGYSLNQLSRTWEIANGLRVVGKGTKVYLLADTTGSGASTVTSFAWTFNGKPVGSNATFDSSAAPLNDNSFTADSVGFYYLQVSVNGGKVAADTIYASTYIGVSADANGGCFCHPDATTLKRNWQATGHAQIFGQGVTGQLEVDANVNKGLYAKNCIQCHTVGWQPKVNNGNFGYLANNTPAPGSGSWDSTWFKGLPMTADGRDVMITPKDSTIYKAIPASMLPTATIGCESCHGPLAGHTNFNNIYSARFTQDKPLNAAVCNQCHDGSGRHSLGSAFNTSAHALLPTGTASEGGRSSCQPCHTGKGFLYYLENDKDTTGIAALWNTATDAGTQISCQVCHDPHGKPDASNPFHLRTLVKDSLKNGYRIPAGLGGEGQLCANCHAARYSVKDRVTTTPPYFGFTNRFGPHENPQADMFFGSNGYQYGDESFTGLATHTGLENGCVTCHMQERTRSGNALPNHSFSMADTAFGFRPTEVCSGCHGEVSDYNDVRAFYDYDRNGRIEGVQTEIQGLMTALKAKLPLDAATGEPVTMTKDTLKVKNRPDLVQGIWNYYLVKNDKSMGIHNTKYAVRLLYKALGWTPLFVKEVPGTMPTQFALDQNYPNPFNPSTVIRFALPSEQHVKLDVYDMTGAHVKTLLNESVRAGNKEATWDGTNNSGVKVASGIYLYRLQAGEFSAVKKMIMLK